MRRRAGGMSGCDIRIIGPIARGEVQDLMRAHSVYCLPSYWRAVRHDHSEAMACGVPVVATRAGGIPDLLTREGGRAGASRVIRRRWRLPSSRSSARRRCSDRWGGRTAPVSRRRSKPRKSSIGSRTCTTPSSRDHAATSTAPAGPAPTRPASMSRPAGNPRHRLLIRGRCDERCRPRRFRLRERWRRPHRAGEREGPGQPRSSRHAVHRRRTSHR